MKIFTNSYPRSGATGFNRALLFATEHLVDRQKDELIQNENWILKNHNPVIFLGKCPEDVTPCAIIRNPLDAVASNSFRWSKGFNGNMIHGRLVVNSDQTYKESELNSELRRLIDHQIEQYISYLYSLLSNPDKVVMFTYEQIKNKTVWCAQSLISFTDVDYKKIDKEKISFALQQKEDSDEKTEIYFKIKEYIENSYLYKDALKYYNEVINILNIKQQTYLMTE